MDVSDVSVSTEASTGKNNRIDILLDLPDISIAIENKVDAGLYNDLADYRSWAAKTTNNDSAIVIVLHPFNNFVLKDHPSAQGLVVKQDLFDVHYDELFSNALGMLGEYSLDADPRAVDLLQQFIDNYSPERKQKKMDNTSTDITQFVSQANGIEQQLVNVRQSFEKYTEAGPQQATDSSCGPYFTMGRGKSCKWKECNACGQLGVAKTTQAVRQSVLCPIV